MKILNATTTHYQDPILEPVLIPVEHNATPLCINDTFMVDGKPYGVTAMRLDTPHGAVVVNDVEAVDVESLGAALGNHALFPEGASIVFIQVLDRQTLKARLWRLGKGEAVTPESVCVAGVAAMMLQRTLGHRVRVFMGGGVSVVDWSWGKGISLSSPARLLEERERHAG